MGAGAFLLEEILPAQKSSGAISETPGSRGESRRKDRQGLKPVESCNLKFFFAADLPYGLLAVARIPTGKPTTCGNLPGNGNDPCVQARCPACLLEQQGHVGRIEGGKALHKRIPQSSGNMDCYVIIPRLRMRVRVESNTVARKNPKEGVRWFRTRKWFSWQFLQLSS